MGRQEAARRGMRPGAFEISLCVCWNNVLEGVSRTDAYPGTNPFRSCQIARQYLTLMRAAAHCISHIGRSPLGRVVCNRWGMSRVPKHRLSSVVCLSSKKMAKAWVRKKNTALVITFTWPQVWRRTHGHAPVTAAHAHGVPRWRHRRLFAGTTTATATTAARVSATRCERQQWL
jgi:hypothetical protein